MNDLLLLHTVFHKLFACSDYDNDIYVKYLELNINSRLQVLLLKIVFLFSNINRSYSQHNFL